MNEKAVYSQKAPLKNNVGLRTLLFLALAILIMALLFVVNLLPYSGVLTLVVFAAGAWGMYKILSDTVFDITYVLYEDRLVFVRKYGKMEWECEVFPFEEAKFFSDRIEHRGKSYAFSPDAKLKELLNV